MAKKGNNKIKVKTEVKCFLSICKNTLKILKKKFFRKKSILIFIYEKLNNIKKMYNKKNKKINIRTLP